MEEFPILTPIPFVLNIVTTSKPMKWEDTPAHCPIFPALPHTPDESIDFTIVRDVYLRAGRYRSIDRDAFVANVGGFGKQSAVVADESPMHVEAKEKVWCPLSADRNVGSWRQEVTFTSSFVLRCAPTFCSRIMILEVSDCNCRLSILLTPLYNFRIVRAETEGKVSWFQKYYQGQSSSACGIERTSFGVSSEWASTSD